MRRILLFLVTCLPSLHATDCIFRFSIYSGTRSVVFTNPGRSCNDWTLTFSSSGIATVSLETSTLSTGPWSVFPGTVPNTAVIGTIAAIGSPSFLSVKKLGTGLVTGTLIGTVNTCISCVRKDSAGNLNIGNPIALPDGIFNALNVQGGLFENGIKVGQAGSGGTGSSRSGPDWLSSLYGSLTPDLTKTIPGSLHGLTFPILAQVFENSDPRKSVPAKWTIDVATNDVVIDFAGIPQGNYYVAMWGPRATAPGGTLAWSTLTQTQWTAITASSWPTILQ